jgi:hypothetical protein
MKRDPNLMGGFEPKTALEHQRLREKGRVAPPSWRNPSTDRPAEWGPWEWRPQVVDPKNRQVRAGAARGIAMPPGLKRACLNNVYSVMFYEKPSDWGLIDHLMIRRHDTGTDVPWVDKQRIKDELLGVDRVAVEVYPARGDLVDDANIYHLWVLPAGFALPFGLHL